MTNLIQFLNKLDINKEVNNTIQNIDDLGLKLLDINKIIKPDLINEYKILNLYKSYLIQHLSIIDFIMNKDKYQNYINNLLNTILNSKKFHKFKNIKDILIDNIYKFNYEQYGGGLLDGNMGIVNNITIDGKIDQNSTTYIRFIETFNTNIDKYIEEKEKKYQTFRSNIDTEMKNLNDIINYLIQNNSTTSTEMNELKEKIEMLLQNISKYNKYTKDEEQQINDILTDINSKILTYKQQLNSAGIPISEQSSNESQ